MFLAMKQLTDAITAMQAQIARLQSDIETLQRASTVLGGKSTPAKPAPGRPKAKRKRRKVRAAAKAVAGEPKTTEKRKPTWSATDREAISKRMKAYWAKRRKARG